MESLAAALSEERGTLEDVIEPFLIQQGFLIRTARGRMVTNRTWRHLGLTPPRRPDSPHSGELFDAQAE
ncbi:Holliday junction ATP-dependent DNA helicase RuvB [compost metagenome]